MNKKINVPKLSGSSYSVREVIDPKSGAIRRFYAYKRKPAKRILLESPMARQLAGYVLIEKDLRSATVWLREIEKIRDNDMEKNSTYNHLSSNREQYNIVKGLFVAALTFYGKAFAQCEGRRIKLDRRQIGEEYLKSHDLVIDFRNNFAAHSGAQLVEEAKVVLVLPPKKNKDKIIPEIFREMNQPDLFIIIEDNKSFLQLIEHAREIPLRKIQELTEKIFKEEVIPRGYEYWEKL